VEISKAEFEVLEAIWRGSPCSANEIIERLDDSNNWHEKTVKTLLGRLVKKGAIDFQKQQRHYLYHPLIGKEEYSLKESSNLLSKLFDGRVSPMVASFAKQKGLGRDDIAELKKVIAEWEQEND
jgi:BlaI family penicillinase repressor